MNDDLEGSRRDILAAALHHVPFDGWSARTLRGATADLGLDRTLALRAFPRGADDLLAFFHAEADRLMVEELSRRDLGSMRIRDRVATGVRVRLEQHDAHREAIRRALARESLPSQAGRALRHLYRTVDAIWRAAGDDATDFNFYSKRALLAWVYGGTLLYWLDDRSEACRDTWAFLDRRIDDVMRIQKARGRLGDAVKRWLPLSPYRRRSPS